VKLEIHICDEFGPHLMCKCVAEKIHKLTVRLEAAENALLSVLHSSDGRDFDAAVQLWRKTKEG
jgi:hypothetical protein